jgi:hypothetical protein
MPIKVQCACGAAFAAKDELAGKTVKCPKCKKPLKISASAGAAAKSAGQAGAAKQPAAGKAAPVAKAVKVKPMQAESAAVLPVTSTESLFDEIGLQAAAAGTRPCPGCTEPMPIEAVICIKCGYNARLGRRMETAKFGGSGGDGEGGHGSVTAALMERAAQVLDDDVKEDIKKTSEGMPWWVYLVGLAALVGFLGVMVYRGCVYEAEEQKKKEQGQKGQIQSDDGVRFAGVRSPTALPWTEQLVAEAIRKDHSQSHALLRSRIHVVQIHSDGAADC